MRMRTQAVASLLASAALSAGVLASPAGATGQAVPAGSAGPATAAGSATPEATASSTSSTDNRTMDTHGVFTGDGVRIRQGSATGPVLGLGYRGQPVTVHCNAEYSPGLFEFVIGTNNATGVTGYIYRRYVSVVGDRPC